MFRVSHDAVIISTTGQKGFDYRNRKKDFSSKAMNSSSTMAISKIVLGMTNAGAHGTMTRTCASSSKSERAVTCNLQSRDANKSCDCNQLKTSTTSRSAKLRQPQIQGSRDILSFVCARKKVAIGSHECHWRDLLLVHGNADARQRGKQNKNLNHSRDPGRFFDNLDQKQKCYRKF